MGENYSTVELIETAVNDFMTQYKKEVSNGFVPSVDPAIDDICEDETNPEANLGRNRQSLERR